MGSCWWRRRSPGVKGGGGEGEGGEGEGGGEGGGGGGDGGGEGGGEKGGKIRSLTTITPHSTREERKEIMS